MESSIFARVGDLHPMHSDGTLEPLPLNEHPLRQQCDKIEVALTQEMQRLVCVEAELSVERGDLCENSNAMVPAQVQGDYCPQDDPIDVLAAENELLKQLLAMHHAHVRPEGGLPNSALTESLAQHDQLAVDHAVFNRDLWFQLQCARDEVSSASAELKSLESQLHDSRQEADLLLKQLLESQQELERYYLLARGHQRAGLSDCLRQKPPSDLVMPASDAINSNRARLLAQS